jgi:hypothetical protein
MNPRFIVLIIVLTICIITTVILLVYFFTRPNLHRPNLHRHCKVMITPEYLTELGYNKFIPINAFKGCSDLVFIDLCELTSLEEIRDNAFSNCPNLIVASLPVSVINIGENVFKNCPKLKEVTLSMNAALSTRFNFITEYDLYLTYIRNYIENFTLSDGSFYDIIIGDLIPQTYSTVPPGLTDNNGSDKINWDELSDCVNSSNNIDSCYYEQAQYLNDYSFSVSLEDTTLSSSYKYYPTLEQYKKIHTFFDKTGNTFGDIDSQSGQELLNAIETEPKQRVLKINYSRELREQFREQFGTEIREQLANIILQEIMNEIRREKFWNVIDFLQSPTPENQKKPMGLYLSRMYFDNFPQYEDHYGTGVAAIRAKYPYKLPNSNWEMCFFKIDKANSFVTFSSWSAENFCNDINEVYNLIQKISKKVISPEQQISYEIMDELYKTGEFGIGEFGNYYLSREMNNVNLDGIC